MKKSRFLNVWLFFFAVYLISALLYLPILLSGTGRSGRFNLILMVTITFVPSLMGIAFTYVTKNREERQDFWKRVIRWPKGRTKIALVGLLLPPLLTIISFLFAWFITGKQLSFSYAIKVLTNWRDLLTFLIIEFTLGAVSEELGWRGYALDELQSHWNALTSSLVLGLIWAFWHTPAFLIPGLSQYEMGGVFSVPYVCFMMIVTLSSILHTWIYNNTNRSILVAGILMHASSNITITFLGGLFDTFLVPPAYWVVMLILTTLIAAIILIIYGSKSLTKLPANNLLVER